MRSSRAPTRRCLVGRPRRFHPTSTCPERERPLPKPKCSSVKTAHPWTRRVPESPPRPTVRAPRLRRDSLRRSVEQRAVGPSGFPVLGLEQLRRVARVHGEGHDGDRDGGEREPGKLSAATTGEAGLASRATRSTATLIKVR